MSKISSLLLSPWSALTGMFVGIALGFSKLSWVKELSNVGDIYLALLQMAVLPLVITAVVTSFYKLFQSAHNWRFIRLIFLSFLVSLLVGSCMGLFVALFAKVGIFNEETKLILGRLFFESGGLDEQVIEKTKGWGIVGTLIPTNIFSALAQGQMLSIVFFSVFLGLALTFIKKDLGTHFYTMLVAGYDTFFTIIRWILHLLPFGVCAVIAGQIALSGIEVLLALTKYIGYLVLAILVLMFILIIVIAMIQKISPFESLRRSHKTLVIAFGTQSFVASIPQILHDLEHKFLTDTDINNFIVPMGMTIARQGVSLLFAYTLMTVMQVYGVKVSFFDMSLIIVGSALLATAAVGPITSTISLIALLSHIMATPVGAPSIFVISTAPIITPFIVMLSALSLMVITVGINQVMVNKMKEK
jgi:proton glutamate symport protein